MDKRNFAFDKTNFILLGVGMAVVIVGFLLMAGSASTDTAYEPDIFSPRRTAVAPIITLAGYLLMTIGILWRGEPTARCR